MKVYRTSDGRTYRLADHARNRMAQRQVRRLEVQQVLDRYDAVYTDRQGNLCLVGHLENGRRLRVVVAKDSSPLTIITVIALD